MIRFLLFVFIIGCANLLAGCGSHVHHQVQKGETLYSISWRYHQNYKDVAKWNDIASPYIIHPGQWIRLVSADVVARTVPASSAGAPVRSYGRSNIEPVLAEVVVRNNSPLDLPKPFSGVVETANLPTINTDIANKAHAIASSLSSRFPVSWQWPTQGKIIHRYNAGSLGKKGLGIRAQRGAPIYAAAAGKVVYSGSGLKGYGNLVIIKHNEKYLSAYGHNNSLLVKDGDYVKKGQVIARMGDTESIGVKLHFEIRVDGKPQNPVRYLPKTGA